MARGVRLGHPFPSCPVLIQGISEHGISWLMALIFCALFLVWFWFVAVRVQLEVMLSNFRRCVYLSKASVLVYIKEILEISYRISRGHLSDRFHWNQMILFSSCFSPA